MMVVPGLTTVDVDESGKGDAEVEVEADAKAAGGSVIGSGK